MKIIAFGDIHMEYEALKDIPGLSQAELVIVTGDFTNFGGKEEASTVLDAIRGFNPNVWGLLGNLDQPSVDDFLTGQGINLHGQGRVFAGELGIFGVGGSNPTPFNTPTEFPEEELSRIVHSAYRMVEGAPVKLLVSHTPPVNTKTDRISSGAHVGSSAIRRFIEEVQPDICITGHIHESRGEDRIGKTIVLNPGMLRDPGWVEITRTGDGWTARMN